MWCIDQFYILFWILPGSGTAYCLSWRYLHWLDIEISYRVFDTDQFILSKWWEPTAGNSWRRVWLSWNVWWRGYTLLWVLDIEMHWHCEDNDQICSSYLSESLCDEMFRYCEDNTYIIVIVIYRSYIWSWTMPFIASKSVVVLRRLWSSLTRTILSLRDFALHCGLAITVVERLQRYNCIWLTYIVNVERRMLFYIEVWSCEMLSLCGKLIWRWNVVFWLWFICRRRLYRIPCMNHFVLEKLTLTLALPIS